MDIGFIGLGNMGSGMAANLVKAGHTVLGFDVAGVGVDGVRKVASALDAARTTEIVITMLPNGQVLQAVAEEILPSMQSGKLFMDCSSVDVQSARTVHAKAASKSISCIDAPVSGGSAGADAGTLTFMAGGSKEAFERAQPLFDVMGKKAVHCGDAGAGQIAKICNNMILGVTMAVTGEAFALGQKLGLDPQKLFDVVSTSSGSSWSSNTYCPVPGVGPNAPSDNSYQPGFAAELMLKDLRLSQEAAVLADADTTLGALATDIF
ncbi:MAG: 3-hydroxyisobutyrate dehydrogenase, partial [Pseudomonadota bacterium]